MSEIPGRRPRLPSLETFGGCTLVGECQAACPKEISIDTIARMNRDYIFGAAFEQEESRAGGAG